MLQWLAWDDAVAIAAGTGAAAVATTRRARRLHPWCRETTLLLVLYAMWQYAGVASLAQASGAVARGRWIWRLERRLGLPSEHSLQAPLLAHHSILHWANEWYAQVHVPALGLLLVWLFARHRDRYGPVRTVVVAVTAASLLVALVPVAPPRLVPGLGIVDTGAVIGPSTYAGGAPGIDQLSAMPSLHVGWALIVAGAVVWASRRRWRWLAVAYPVVTTWVVLVTGNHYEADAVVAACLVVVATAVVGPTRRRPPPPGVGTRTAPGVVPIGRGVPAGQGRTRTPIRS